MLCKRYKSRTLKEDDILLCLYSISDNNSFLLFNRDPSGYMLLLPVRFCGSASPIMVSLRSVGVSGAVLGVPMLSMEASQCPPRLRLGLMRGVLSA